MSTSRADSTRTERPRLRLSPEERERQIVEGAVRFFAEVGFEGQTRELAKRLGITQPLLYRYFPSKEHLVERVYQEVFLARWRPGWDELVTDRSRPLEDRLIQLYQEYTRFIFHYEAVRLFMFAGLAGGEMNRRYLALVREKLLEPLCIELRYSNGLPDPQERPLTEAEVDMAVALHGSIYYAGIRRWVYDLPLPEDLDGHVVRIVRTYLRGAPPTVREYLLEER